MEVHEESFCDHDEPDENGFYSWVYEYTSWVFDFGAGRTVRGRRYTDTPSTASLFFNPDGPMEGDPELTEIVGWLTKAGVSDIQVLGGPEGTYRPLEQSG